MDRFAVIGLGLFGRRLAHLLTEAGADVIAIDRRQDVIDEIRDRVSLAVCLDSTNADALRAQGIDAVDVAIVGIGTAFESAVLTAVLLKQLGVKRVICRATGQVRSQIFMRIGADEVINPEREAAERWRNRLLVPAVLERSVLAEGTSLIHVAAPRRFVGKTLGELHIRRKFEINVVAIRRTVEHIDDDGVPRTRQEAISVPTADTRIEAGDVLLLIGTDDALAAFPVD